MVFVMTVLVMASMIALAFVVVIAGSVVGYLLNKYPGRDDGVRAHIRKGWKAIEKALALDGYDII